MSTPMLKFSRRRIASAVRYFSSVDSSPSDHYRTLGLKRSATQAEVKAAYFELSKLYHPDRAKSSHENIDKFREVTAAYEVLGNVDSRRMYDRGSSIDDEFGHADEDSDDPLKRYENIRRTSQMGSSFDAWTREEYQRMREKRESFIKQENEMKNESQSSDSSFSAMSYFFVLVILFYFFESSLSPISDNPSRNKIENRLNNSSEKKSS